MIINEICRELVHLRKTAKIDFGSLKMEYIGPHESHQSIFPVLQKYKIFDVEPWYFVL